MSMSQSNTHTHTTATRTHNRNRQLHTRTRSYHVRTAAARCVRALVGWRTSAHTPTPCTATNPTTTQIPCSVRMWWS